MSKTNCEISSIQKFKLQEKLNLDQMDFKI